MDNKYVCLPRSQTLVTFGSTITTICPKCKVLRLVKKVTENIMGYSLKVQHGFQSHLINIHQLDVNFKKTQHILSI